MLKVQENVEQVVFQLKFPYGQLYLDRCGRIIREILKDQPDWILTDNSTPQGSSLICSENGCVFNFSSNSTDLSLKRDLDGDPISDEDMRVFFEQIDVMSAIVVDRLDITEISRIGFRLVFCFPVNSGEDADQWGKKRNLWTVDQHLKNVFEGMPKSEAMILEFECIDRGYRLAIQPGERPENRSFGSRKHLVRSKDLPRSQRDQLSLNEKKRYKEKVVRISKDARIEEWNKPNVAIVDVDSFAENPDPDVKAGEFAKSSSEKIFEVVGKIEKGFDNS